VTSFTRGEKGSEKARRFAELAGAFDTLPALIEQRCAAFPPHSLEE